MSNLFSRIQWASANLEPFQSQYAVVFEADIDSACSIMHPDPNWVAMALHGDLLPPVDVYHNLKFDDQGRVLNGHILHETPPIAALSEEEAIEYLIQKDIPPHVWVDSTGNRPRFSICKRSMVPTNREFRNAWRLAA